MKQIFIAIVLMMAYQLGFAGEVMLAPGATISGPTAVCQGAANQSITFTGSGGTAPYTFTYTVTGTSGNQIVATTGSSNLATVAIPTTTPGTYTYNLVSVRDASSADQPVTGQSVVVTVTAPPTVNITSNSTANTCSGTAVQFTSTVAGTGPFTYSWDFGDGTPLSNQQNPSHAFVSLGCGTASFNVVLTVTAGGCTVTRNLTVTVKQQPDISFIDPNATSANQFSNCSSASLTNTIYSITVENTSSSLCVTSYSINWGDSTIENNITFPRSHTYSQLGVYNMVITAVGSNGCSNSVTYRVKNISNPSVGVLNPGGTVDMCIPTPIIQYSIGNWGQNSPGTTYAVDYGDGSPILNLDQETMVASSYYNAANPALSTNYPIPYSYNTVSCPSDFIITLTATNACRSTTGTVVGGNTRSKPLANFTNPPEACITSNVLFTNTTILGYDNGCARDTRFTWDFGDPASGASNTITTGWLTTAQNANHTFSSSGTYTVTLTALNGCGTSTKPQQICIEPTLTPTFTLDKTSGCIPLAVTTNNTTSLTGQCLNTTYDWQVNYASGNCGTASGYTYTNGTSNTSVSPSFNFTQPGTYSISVLMTNSCGTVTSATQTVTVAKPPVINAINGIQANYCGSTSINPTANVSACSSGILEYFWSFPGGTPVNPADLTTPTPGIVNYITPGTYTVSLMVRNVCGDSSIQTSVFNVNTAPIVTNTPLSQSVCSGTSTTEVILTSNPPGATFEITATATSGITGFNPPSGQVTSLPAMTINTSNSSQGTVTYVITPNFGGCPGPPVNYIVTVNPAPVITTQPASSTVCLGGTPTALTIALSSTAITPTYQWYFNNNPVASGGTLISGATGSTYNPPATTVGILYYYCIIRLSSGGCTDITSNIATVTVEPMPTIATQPTATQNICVGITIPAPLTVSHTGGAGAITYEWFSNTNSTTVGGTPIPGATTANYTPPVFNTAGTFYYYAIITLAGNNCGTVTSASAEVIVYNDPTVTAQPLATQTLCQGVTPTTLQVTATGGNGAFSYQWYSNTLNNTTTGTLISGAINATYVPPATSVGTMYYYCIISQATLGCNVTSATAEVIINVSPNITTQPQSDSLCEGGTANALSFSYSNGVGTPTYQWYYNSSPVAAGGILISSAINATYVPPTANVGVLYYYCLITFPDLTGSCATIPTAVATITVTPNASINQQPIANQSVCVGGSLAAALTVTYTNGNGIPTYQWYSNTINSPSGGTPVGTNSPDYTPSIYTTAGSYYYYVVISFSGSGCGNITSDVAQVDVVNDPVVTVQPLALQTVCQNSPATALTVTATGGIGTTYFYQWYSNATNSPSGGTAIAGATTDTYTPPTATAGTLYYYCLITQASTACDATSAVARVEVNLAPTVTTQPMDRNLCLGDLPQALTFTYNNGAGTPLFEWYSNAVDLNSGGNAIPGAINATYTPPVTSVGVMYYYCVVFFPDLSGNCARITTDAAEIIVNQVPVIAPASATICSTNIFEVEPDTIAGNIVPANTLYTWATPTINPPGAITGAVSESVGQLEISQSLINTTTNPATVTYTVTPASGICIGNDFTLTITVNPSINPNVVVTNNLCYNVDIAAINTNITGGIPPYVITWSGPNGYNSSADDITNLEPGTYHLNIMDQGNCPFDEDYVITEPTDIVITVDSVNNITCYNADNGSIDISVTGGTGSYTYQWSNGETTQDINNLAPGTYTVDVSDANNCGPIISTFTIIEPPQLLVSLVNQTNVICYDQATGAINVAVTGGTLGSGYTFSWTGPNGYASGNQNLSGIKAGTYNLTVTDANTCVANLTVVITQNPEIIIAYTTTPISCYGANDASFNVTLSGGVPPYTFTWSNLSTSLFQDNLSAGDYTIIVRDNLNCVQQQTINIPEAPVFMINPIVRHVSCNGANNGSINLNLTGGIAPVTLTWLDGSTAGLIRNNLSPGTYSARIGDGTPCFLDFTVTIVQPQPLVLSANTVNPLGCTVTDSGSIDLVVSGGTPPFTYLWSDGATSEDIGNLVEGNYAVNVTDANGCTATGTYTIIRPVPLQVAVTTQTDFDCDLHEVTQSFIAQASGGVPPYQYAWSSGTVSGANNEIMQSDVNGTIILTVTDSRNCAVTYTVNVDNPVLGYASFDATSYGHITYGIYSIGDPIQFTSTITGDYESIVWDFGDGTFSNELDPEHTYLIEREYVVTQTVTYPFGCVYVQTIRLNIEKGYIIVVPTAFTPNNDSMNDHYRPFTKRMKNVKMDIYDTWGSLIYSESGEVLTGWDGKIKGFSAENGNYYSRVSAETFYGTVIKEDQTFVLIK